VMNGYREQTFDKCCKKCRFQDRAEKEMVCGLTGNPVKWNGVCDRYEKRRKRGG